MSRDEDLAALAEYEMEVRPTCLMRNFRLNKGCENPAEYTVRVYHGPSHRGPGMAYVCSECIRATKNQHYPAKCPRCDHVFESWTELIHDIQPL